MTANPGELLRAALRYAELGYPVFPCAPGTKKPLTQHGFHDASADADQIEAWWAQHPTANIGIPTVGLIVIDIDGEGNPWMADAPDRMLDLATGPMALTPRGGSHRIFRQPPGKTWRCTESRLAPRVDTRADGGYIVAPPSVVTGKGKYVWAPGLELDTARDSLPQPPGWLVENLDRLETTPKEPANGSPTLAHVAAVGDEANAIPEGQRNATLARLAGGMRRFGMSRAEIAAAILRVNQDRCVPPLAPAEVERIAASIARYEPDGVARALAENHFDQMYADTVEGDDPSLVDPGPIADEMLHVPGFVSDVMKYTLETAPYPEPVLAFAGALTLQALLAGRKVADPMENRTNLYVLGLANSGVGKDHARKVNARILYEVGLANCLGTSFASGEGIEDRLSAEPATLFQVDEIDGLLLRVSQAKDARHEAIVSMLLQMYSSASSVYVMRAKAGRDRSVINQPHLCLFGTAVPQHFYEALTARQMTNGFLARLLVIECRKRGEGQEANQRAVPNNILEAARWWADLRPGGNLHAEHPTPRIVPASDEAVTAFAELRKRIDGTYDECQVAGDTAGMAIWARALEKARRLALVYACSVDRVQPTITREAVAWAGAFAVHQTQRMLFMARHYAAESEFDGKRKRLLDLLDQWRRQHGDEWMPFWKINRKLPWSNREHDEIRDTLLHQRLIETRSTTTKGRPGMVYRLAPIPTKGGTT